MKLLIERVDDSGVQTLGKMYVLNESNGIQFSCDTLELPWKDNKNSISCIPTGEYEVKKRYSPKFGNHFHLTNVKDRSYILIHKGNYHTDIRGCILVGSDLADINSDGHLDVTSSGTTMNKLLKIMPDKFDLTIVQE